MKMYKAGKIEPIDSFYFFSSVIHAFLGFLTGFLLFFFFTIISLMIFIFGTFNMIIYICEFIL